MIIKSVTDINALFKAEAVPIDSTDIPIVHIHVLQNENGGATLQTKNKLTVTITIQQIKVLIGAAMIPIEGMAQSKYRVSALIAQPVAVETIGNQACPYACNERHTYSQNPCINHVRRP